MEQKKSEVSIFTAVVAVLVTVAIVVGIGIYVGNQFFWKPDDVRTLIDRRFDDIETTYKKNPKLKNPALAYAIALGERGNKAQADKIFNELLKTYPKDNALLFNYGVFKKATGDVNEAKKAYEKILKKAPYFVAANVNYGIILREEGKNSEALEKFANALRIDPGAADIIVERAKVYIAMKDTEKARADLNKALSYVPNYEEAQKLLKDLK